MNMQNKLGILIKFLRFELKPCLVVMAPSVLTAFTFGYQGLILPCLLKLLLCVFLLIVGGSIINDWVDIEYDRQIPRSAVRPMAARLISERWVLVCVPFFAAFLYMQFYFNPCVMIFFYLSLIMTILYPFAKRIVKAPQIFLGLINFSPIMAYVETTLADSNWIRPLSMYFMGVIWITLYDTLYAWQDLDADKRLGLGNLGIILGKKYMPAFIELCWLVMGLCYCFQLSMPIGAIVFVMFVTVGVRMKSRFIKQQLI